MTTAVVFPGQGSQTVGMGRALAGHFKAAQAVFDEVDDALGEKLSEIMFEGPEATLTLTTNAQPALMASSIAVLRVLEAECGFVLAKASAYVAGHSLGEYSALAAAGSLTLPDTARLLRIRGNAMQKAVPAGEGAMAAIIGLDFAVVNAVATEAARELYLTGAICEAANDNGGGQVVISGTKAAVEKAMELAKAKGAKRAIMLPVSAPFHCSLMTPAAEAMQDALARVTIVSPCVPLIANVTALPVTNPDDIRRGLVEQVTGTVRWRETVSYLAGQGVTHFLELGTGKVLSGLIKRIADGVSTTSISSPEDIVAFKTSSL